jgi:hypothetical protein
LDASVRENKVLLWLTTCVLILEIKTEALNNINQFCLIKIQTLLYQDKYKQYITYSKVHRVYKKLHLYIFNNSPIINLFGHTFLKTNDSSYKWIFNITIKNHSIWKIYLKIKSCIGRLFSLLTFTLSDCLVNWTPTLSSKLNTYFTLYCISTSEPILYQEMYCPYANNFF